MPVQNNYRLSCFRHQYRIKYGLITYGSSNDHARYELDRWSGLKRGISPVLNLCAVQHGINFPVRFGSQLYVSGCNLSSYQPLAFFYQFMVKFYGHVQPN